MSTALTRRDIAGGIDTPEPTLKLAQTIEDLLDESDPFYEFKRSVLDVYNTHLPQEKLPDGIFSDETDVLGLYFISEYVTGTLKELEEYDVAQRVTYNLYEGQMKYLQEHIGEDVTVEFSLLNDKLVRTKKLDYVIPFDGIHLNRGPTTAVIPHDDVKFLWYLHTIRTVTSEDGELLFYNPRAYETNVSPINIENLRSEVFGLPINK